jgi:imidazolonepropionase-like amidohydrolase
MLRLARATDEGWVDGPRIFPVGHYITITGGHCDFTGLAPGILERGPEAGVADGPDEVVKAIRYQIKHGAKWIKMCATAGVFSFEGPVGAQQYSEAELRAGVEDVRDCQQANCVRIPRILDGSRRPFPDRFLHYFSLSRKVTPTVKPMG